MASTVNITTHSTINRETPNVLIYTNQALVARSLAHYRRETEKAAQLRISLQRYDTLGYLTHSFDARLSEDYLQDPGSTIPNQSQVNTLSGAVLQSKNVDAGMRINISDVRGLMVWTNDSRGNERAFVYDTLARVTSVHETAQGKKEKKQCVMNALFMVITR